MWVGNTTPLGTLHFGDVSQANNDGRIIFAKCTTIGSTIICRVGYNNSFEFVIGDTGRGNALTTLIERLHLDVSDDSNPNKYGLTILVFVIGGGQVGYRFKKVILIVVMSDFISRQVIGVIGRVGMVVYSIFVTNDEGERMMGHLRI
jgi:hypothetical protein